MKDFVLKPRVSEKLYAQSKALNVFGFLVPRDSNKHTIARAIETQYEVDVIGVNVLNQAGKTVRAYRNRRSTSGSRSDYKKAYVTIKKGQSLPVFAAVDEAEAKADSTQKQVDKQAKKKAKD